MLSMSDSEHTAITGRYADGKSAEARAVDVVPILGGLSLREPGESREIARWSLANILILDDLGEGRARFGLGNARLTVEDPAAAAALRTAASEIFDATPPERRPTPQLLAVAILAIGGLIGAYFALPAVGKALSTVVPHDWYEKAGRGAVEQMATVLGGFENDGYCRPGDGLDALRALMVRLDEGNQTKTPVTVHVIDSGMINAFAAPGGHIIVMRGLIDFVDSPTELVGVLAHEYAHVQGRHPESGLVQAVLGSVLTRVVLGGQGDIANQLGIVGGYLLDLSHSRDVEASADAVGLEMLVASGMRTDGLAKLFERLEELQESESIEVPEILSSHPSSATRVEASNAAQGGRDPGLTDAAWEAVQAMCPN
jgi:Zn-dependent protease with chaperone function